MRRPWILTLAVAALLIAAPTLAQQKHPRDIDPLDGASPDAPPISQRVHFALDFHGVPGCGERGLFEDTMRVHFWGVSNWWDPFAPVSPWPLKVRVTQNSRGWFSGTIDFKTPNGRPFHHEITGPTACYEMISWLTDEVITDVLVLFPHNAKPEPACPASKPSPEIVSPACADSRYTIWPTEWPLSPLEKPKPDPPKPLERWPVAVRASVTLWPELIATGWGSLGLTAEFGARFHAFSAGVELHGDPSLGSVSYGHDDAVSFARLSGAFLLCGHVGFFTGCGVADAGRFIFLDHPASLPASTLYGSAGVRAGLELPIAPPHLFLRIALDLRAPIHPASYSFKGSTVFEAAGLSGGLGFGLIYELPLWLP